MTSRRTWGWVLLITGLILDLGIGAIIAVAFLNRGTFGLDGMQWVYGFFALSSLIAGAGVFILSLSKPQSP